MSLAGKIFAVISLVAAVFYAGITAALMSLQENYMEKFEHEKAAHDLSKQNAATEKKSTERQWDQTKGELKRANESITTLRGQRDDNESGWRAAAALNKLAMAVIGDQEDQIALLNTRNDRYNEDLKTIRGEADKKQARIDELDTKYKELLANRDALQDLLTTTQNSLTNATTEVKKLTDDLTTANDILNRIKERDPEAYAGFLKPVAEVRVKEVIRGKVTGVDKSLGLVIINIGQRHKVQKGYAFIVFRGDQYIGKVVVDEVFPDMAASHYDKPSMKDNVEVGDDVTTRLAIEM